LLAKKFVSRVPR